MEMVKELFNKNFIGLFLGQLATHLGDAIIQILLVFGIMNNVEKPGSLIALMLFCFVFPALFISPIAGIIVDRFSRKKVMIYSALYRGVVLAAVFIFYTFLYNKALLPSIIHIVAMGMSLLIGIGTAFFYPAKMAAVPNVVKIQLLKPANALVSGSGTWALTFGSMVVSIILLHVSQMTLFLSACGMYFAAALILLTINLKNDEDSVDQEFSFSADLKKTMSFLNQHKKAFEMIILGVVLSLISATFFNAMNAIATDTYNVSVQDLSKLKCMLGCGTFYGLGVMFIFGKYLKTNRTLVGAFLGLFLCLITASMCTTFGKAQIWLGGIGLFAAMLNITIDTVLQKVSPNFIRGKIFAFSSVLETFVTLVGTGLVSLLVGIINPLMIVNVIAIICAIMASTLLALNKEFRYFVLRITLGQIFKMLFRYKIEGIENIPQKGKVILAGNHTGHLDPLILQMATSRKPWFVTGPAAFKVPIIKHMLKWFNVVPLNFGDGLTAIEKAVEKLKAGDPVVIFPEGRFTSDGSLCKFHRGVTIMAKEANCPIVPFAIRGGFEAWGKFRKQPKLFTTIIVQFGQPITDISKDEKTLTKELQAKVEYMKASLERRAFYNIKDTHYTNFLDIMKQYSDEYGQTKAVSLKTSEGYEEISYLDLKIKAKTLGNYVMENADVQRGDRIAILCESRPEFAIGMFGSIQTGAITVPLDVKLTVPEHTHILNDCNPKILLTSSHYLEHALELRNTVPSIQNFLY